MNVKVTREKTEILLMEYAAGALDQASSLLAATYIEICPEARRYYRSCESYGGALMEYACKPVAMHKQSLQAVMRRLDDEQPEEKPCARPPSAFCKSQPLPRPLANHIDSCAAAAKWRLYYPGIRSCRLPVSGCQSQAVLFRAGPGAKTPRHTHHGTELTLVLEGGYSDEYGIYKKGDLVIAEPGTTHAPAAGEKSGCTCIIVTEAPVRFTGSASFFLNVFMR